MTEVEKARDLLLTNHYMALATADVDGTPWISNIFYSPDDDFNFYWYSRTMTKHAKNIEVRPQIALNLYVAPSEEEVDGLFIEAECKIVNDIPGILHGMKTYASKAMKNKFMTDTAFKLFMKHPEDFLTDSPFRMYKATPTKIWKFVPLENWKDKYVDGRVEIPLDQLKALKA